MFCRKCAQGLPEDAVACWKCGAATNAPVPQNLNVTPQKTEGTKLLYLVGTITALILMVMLVVMYIEQQEDERNKPTPQRRR